MPLVVNGIDVLSRGVNSILLFQVYLLRNEKKLVIQASPVSELSIAKLARSKSEMMS